VPIVSEAGLPELKAVDEPLVPLAAALVLEFAKFVSRASRTESAVLVFEPLD